MDTIQFVVVWKSGVKEDWCGTCRDIAADNDDVEDILPVMTARLGTCAWCECGADALFADVEFANDPR